jgi:DNA-binding transcriptional MocR family regulator
MFQHPTSTTSLEDQLRKYLYNRCQRDHKLIVNDDCYGKRCWCLRGRRKEKKGQDSTESQEAVRPSNRVRRMSQGEDQGKRV